MCLCHAPLVPLCPDRRRVLRGLSATALALPLAGCDRDTWLFNIVPESQVQALGLQTWAQIRARTPLSQDQRRQGIVRSIADRLLRAEGRDPSRWEVALFASPQVNAFALPGQRIGVFEGMFRVAENPHQLAAVIGHEIGHVVAKHSQSRMNAEAWKTLGLQVINVALGLSNVRYANEIAAVLGAGAEFGLLLPYSRGQELQADRLGLFTMAAAGFDPAQAPKLWQRMDQLVPQRGPTFLATHPAPAARIEALEALVPQARARAPQRAL
ncbi:MAG: M48 family metallopeptidase [Acetobacteraceae bacterium]